MRTEEVLTERAKILEFLDKLAQRHHKYLFEIQDPLMLDKLRRDIRICLNDICRLDTMLVAPSGDGSIKHEIEILDRYKHKLNRLHGKQVSIEKRLRDWEVTDQIGDFQNTQQNGSNFLTISSMYRQLLGQYFDQVGITNTSLGEDGGPHPKLEYETGEIQNNLSLLGKCKQQLDKEIDELESHLSNFKKDREFIMQEVVRQQDIRNGYIHALESELSTIRRSQEKILVKLGISTANQGTTSILSHFNINKHGQEPRDDIGDQLDYAINYIETRRNVLGSELRSFKEDLRVTEQSRNIWEDSLGKIGTLESSLKSMLIENPDISPLKLSTEIKGVVNELRDLHAASTFPVLIMCLGSEIEILQRAHEELSPEARHTPGVWQKKEKAGSLVMGASPPKIGLSTETVLTNSHLMQSEQSNTNLAKMQKKE